MFKKMIEKAQKKKRAKRIMEDIRRGREQLEELKAKLAGTAISGEAAVWANIESTEKRFNEMEARVLAW
jgi:hypothetical protein